MRPVVVSVVGAGFTPIVPVDYLQISFSVGIAVVITGGTALYTVEHTYDDILDPAVNPTWFQKSDMTGIAVNADSSYSSPIRGIRVSSGAEVATVTLTVLQGDPR